MIKKRENKSGLLRQNVFDGISLGFLSCWAALFFRYLFPEFMGSVALQLIKELSILLMILGSFLLVMVFEIVLKNRISRHSRNVAFIGLITLTVIFPFIQLPLWAGILLSLGSCLLLAILFLSCFHRLRQYNHMLSLYTTFIITFALVFSISYVVLDSLGDSLMGFMVEGCLLLAISSFLYSVASGVPHGSVIKEQAVVTGINRRTMSTYFVISVFACLILTLQISHSLTVRQYPYGSYLTMLLMLVASAVLIYRLAVLGKMWYITYTIISMFALGTVLYILSPADLLLSYLSISSLVVALCGMFMLLITFLYYLAPERYRQLFIGLGFVLIFSLLFIVSSPGTGFDRLLSYIDTSLLAIPIIAIFFAMPFILRLFSATVISNETPEVKPVISGPQDTPLYAKLTIAEKRVYELVLLGYPNQKIADTLYISINTVKFHVKNILSKAEVKNKYNLSGYGQLSSTDQQKAAKPSTPDSLDT